MNDQTNHPRDRHTTYVVGAVATIAIVAATMCATERLPHAPRPPTLSDSTMRTCTEACTKGLLPMRRVTETACECGAPGPTSTHPEEPAHDDR